MAAQQTFAFLNTAEAVVERAAQAAHPAEPTALATGLAVATSESPTPVASAVSSPVEPEPAELSQVDDRDTVLRRLRHQVGCVTTAARVRAKLSTGCQAIDAMLPSGGLKADAFTEWVAGSDSSGAATLSMIAAANHLKSSNHAGPLVVVDADHTFYPPAAIALGIPMQRIILVRPGRHADLVWAIDQALRCEAVAAVWAEVGARLDDRDARRFQLAAEIGNTPGFLVRPQVVRGQPSFADVRFHVETKKTEPAACADGSHNRLLQVTLDRCRGGAIGHHVWIQIDDQAEIHSFTESDRHETAAVYLASELANPKVAQPNRRRA